MFHLAISNIGWIPEDDAEIYSEMKKLGFTGLEIAPTRVFPERPYDDLERARAWKKALNDEYGFAIPSMQSIWYGRTESIFGSEEEQAMLTEYTQKAIAFAGAMGCGNLVFGCPKNRVLPEGVADEAAVEFFRTIGDYALANNTVIGMEANPPIYHTNYINTTCEALALIRRVDSEGFKLNLDMGTMIYNNEDVCILEDSIGMINHVHISEPGLIEIRRREKHRQLKQLLEGHYQNYISIEMGRTDDTDAVKRCMAYVCEVFQ